MSSLREIQQDFAKAVLARAAPVLLPHIRGPHAEQRTLLYANTVYGTLGKALGAIYPVLTRLLGQRCFEGLSRQFIHQVPSRSGDLHNFGGEFADLIAGTSLAEDYPYLPEVACLEWQMHRVFHAADTMQVNVQQLKKIEPERYPELCFILAPACALLTSSYPVDLVWQANQPEQDGSVEITPGLTRLMLLRAGGRIEIILLSEGEYVLLSALQSGNNIGVAVEAAIEAETAFDLQLVLAREIERGVIADFMLHQK